jgi:hypothetical protein
MAGERQLPRRGEDANASAAVRAGGGQDEHRLGMIELAGDRLHRLGIEPFRVEHHGEGIAGETTVGEHVEGHEMAAHHPSYSGCGTKTRLGVTNSSWASTSSISPAPASAVRLSTPNIEDAATAIASAAERSPR